MKLRNIAALTAAALVAVCVSPARAAVRVVDAAAASGTFVGAMPVAAPLSLYIALPGRHQAELDGLVAAQNSRSSPLYHHYLSPDQYGRYFGADPTTLQRAVNTLRSAGFSIDEVLPNRRGLMVHARAAAVEALFDTPIDVRRDGRRSYFAARYEPSPRAGLRGALISGLESFRQMHSHHGVAPQVRIGRGYAWGPPDIQSVYDLTPIYATATGQGITVVDATVGFARMTDFNAFNKRFSLSSQLVSTRVGTDIPFDFNGETTLDVEWASAIAPGVTVNQVSPAKNDDRAFDKMYAYIVNSMSTDHIVTTSWGVCEQQMGRHLNIDEDLLVQAATEGQWWLSAAGDGGSDDCGNGVQSVDFPGSSPYVISVGGTEVTPLAKSEGRYQGWKTEVTWDVHGDGAGGGGASTVFAKPAFQTQLTPADGVRDVPDVSFMSDDTDTNGGYFVYFRAGWRKDWGGTSFAAPEWAGFLALVAQEQGGVISSPLQTLYQLAGTAQYDSVFHDVTSGCNQFRHVHGYCATTGYDQASGLGSFVGANLATAFSDTARGLSPNQPRVAP